MSRYSVLDLWHTIYFAILTQFEKRPFYSRKIANILRKDVRSED